MGADRELVSQFINWNMNKQNLTFMEMIRIEKITVHCSFNFEEEHYYLKDALDNQILLKGCRMHTDRSCNMISWLGGIDGKVEWCGFFFVPDIKGRTDCNKIMITMWKDGARGDADYVDYVLKNYSNTEYGELSARTFNLSGYLNPKPKKEECCICLDECKISWRCKTCNAGLICGGCKKNMKGVKSCPVCRTKPVSKKK